MSEPNGHGNGASDGGNGDQPPRRPINIEINMQPYPAAPPPDSGPAEPEEADERPSKRLELVEAISAYVPSGLDSLAIGGMHMHNVPMAFVREIVRQKRRIRRLITSPAASLGADLLIGAGLVDEIVTPYVGFEYLGLAPCFRRAAQEGSLKVYEVDELTLVLGLRAGGANQPFAALPPGLELSDVAQANPDFYRPSTDPFTGREVLVTPALRPQLALVHAQQSDSLGNLLFKGSTFTDREMIGAARNALVQVEQVISNVQATRNPLGVGMPGYYLKGIVEAPFSCHPTSSHRFYHYDEAHLKEYLQLAATPAGFQEYLEKYIYAASETEYLSKTAIATG